MGLVARASGVSRATVSYVLNNDPRQSIPAETRERVLKAARTLGYQPFAPARSLRAGYSRLVLLVVQFEQVDPNVARDLHYLETGLAGHGYSLIWHVGAHVTAGLTHPSANLTPAVQSEYSIWTRNPEPEVLPTCEELGIGFVPWSPLGQGFLTGTLDASTKFESTDFRAAFPRFTEEARKANQAVVDLLNP